MLEEIVVICGLVYLVLIMMNMRAGWIFGTVGSALFVISNIQSQLYMDCLLNSYYTLVGIYGWWVWGRSGQSTMLPVTRMNKKLLAGLLVLSSIVISGLGGVMTHYTNNALPYLDSSVTILSVLATWMAARKYIENWIIWLVADPLAIVLYTLKYYPGERWWLYPGLFLVYSIMAAYGYYVWKKDMRYDA